jgi:hypothetical protein
VLLLLSACIVGQSCASKKAALMPPTQTYQGIVANETSRLQESLFKGDQEVLSNADIERILSARVAFDDRHRLAVLGLSPRPLWSQDLTNLDSQNSQQFLQALRSATQLSQVRFMPALLIPEKRTVPYLREAAARFQADLLLIYTTRIQTFEQSRLIGADEVRAACMAEAVLLDVRTGIVVHTTRSSETIATKKAQGDLNFTETVAKAQGEATGRALVKLAETVVSFLKDGRDVADN